MTGPQSAMIIVLYVLGMGVFLHKHRVLHAVMMGCAILSDVGLTVYLELSRNVLQVSFDQQSSFHGSRSLLAVHIVIAVTLLCTYPVMIITGIRMLRRKAPGPVLASTRRRHGAMACVTFTLYFASLATAPNSLIERFLL